MPAISRLRRVAWISDSAVDRNSGALDLLPALGRDDGRRKSDQAYDVL